MRVGILDILALPSQGPAETLYHALLTKQFASITPQAISVWCRRLGHDTFYAVYYGAGDAHRLLPPDLDVLFVSCYTQVSPIAYAVGLLYREAGTRTVIGGPHAKAFPIDCLRFFDVVVKDCDQELIADILTGQADPGSVISSARPYDDVPTVEERMPEIRASAFYWGRRPLPLSTVPMLASTGCPYRCDFCIDWDNPYRQLPTDRLAADLRYLADRLPGTLIVFHDPNFAVTVRRGLRRVGERAGAGATALHDRDLADDPAGGPTAPAEGDQLRLARTRRRVLDRLLQQGRRRPHRRTGEGGPRRRAVPAARRERAVPAGQFHVRARHRPRDRAGRADQAIHGPDAVRLAGDQHPDAVRRHPGVRPTGPRRPDPARDAIRFLLHPVPGHDAQALRPGGLLRAAHRPAGTRLSIGDAAPPAAEHPEPEGPAGASDPDRGECGPA